MAAIPPDLTHFVCLLNADGVTSVGQLAPASEGRRASPIGRHHHHRPSLDIDRPQEGKGIKHGGHGVIIVADRANGRGPWLRLLRGRCNIIDISFLGMGSTRADPQAALHALCSPDTTLSAGGEE
ncbi:hypothetical protein NQZ68_039631 [Dissostichus eleginoides]|nr:hypothetical protein NQZ68_039631 [Dissostichus eleginoides]